jgi:hypothetical protein
MVAHLKRKRQSFAQEGGSISCLGSMGTTESKIKSFQKSSSCVVLSIHQSQLFPSLGYSYACQLPPLPPSLPSSPGPPALEPFPTLVPPPSSSTLPPLPHNHHARASLQVELIHFVFFVKIYFNQKFYIFATRCLIVWGTSCSLIAGRDGRNIGVEDITGRLQNSNIE